MGGREGGREGGRYSEQGRMERARKMNCAGRVPVKDRVYTVKRAGKRGIQYIHTYVRRRQ